MNQNKLPDEVIALWPEILSDIDVRIIPVEYLACVNITFKDNRVWNVNLSKKKKSDLSAFQKELSELLSHYEKNIVSVDFQINVDKVKKDVQKNTAKFLRKIKGVE